MFAKLKHGFHDNLCKQECETDLEEFMQSGGWKKWKGCYKTISDVTS